MQSNLGKLNGVRRGQTCDCGADNNRYNDDVVEKITETKTMSLKKHTRREWLTMTATALAVPMFIPRTVFAQGARPGANERLGIAGIGVGRFGGPLLDRVLRDERTVAICVCDVLKPRANEVATRHGLSSEHAYQDYRKVIERNDVDAIVIATPDHWHALPSVSAALAGKHLYIEKPVSLTIEDGKLMRAAARKTGVVVQSGSQLRSGVQIGVCRQFIREGGLGKITEVIAANYESPWLANLPAEQIPEGLDWDMWCGPTEPVPYSREVFRPRGDVGPGWISLRPYSGGEMADWGTHGLDQLQFALDLDDTGPVEILVEGEKLVPPVYSEPENRERGNRIGAQPRLTCRYANGITMRLDNGDRGGGIIVGEKGRIEIAGGNVTSNPSELLEEFRREHGVPERPSHTADWLNCIYNGDTPVGELETGIRVATLCHILNIARFVGRNLQWDPVKEEFIGDAEANTWLKREHRAGFEMPAV